MGGINPYQEKIAIKVVTDGFGEATKQTSDFARAGVEANMTLLKSGKQMSDQMDKRSSDSLKQLETDFGNAKEASDKAVADSLNVAQQLSKAGPRVIILRCLK